MNYHKRILVLGTLDSVIAAVAVVIAYLLRFDAASFAAYVHPLVIGSYVVSMWVGISVVKLYNRVWQYASIGEVLVILTAMLLGEGVFFLINWAFLAGRPELAVPRSIYLMSMVLATAGICASRLAWRIIRGPYLKLWEPEQKRMRVLIVGAGDAGARVVQELRSASSGMVPVAFVDDDPRKQCLKVFGLPIVGDRYEIPDVVQRLKIETIVVTIPSASKAEVSKILSICKQTPASVKILPRVADMISGKSTTELIRDVSVEDLLGRDPIRVDLAEIADYVSDQVVLVTGAGGSIGSEICRQIAPFSPRKLLLLGHGEASIFEIDLELRGLFPELEVVPVIADIQNEQAIRNVFTRYLPDVVFHAAAHKHVTLMELNPLEAIKNNVLGTRNVAQSAHEVGCSHFVMISSDKAVNPTSVMGATKRLAELVIQQLNQVSETKFAAVRFGNVLGSRGSVIPLFKRQIQRGGPVTVTHPEMVRYFMTIKEAVQLVIQAGAFAQGGEIFILDMGKPVKIVDLAKDLIRLSGFQPDVDISIAFTGARPGEKLYEELLTDAEGITATKHNSIFVSKLSGLSLERTGEFVSKFEWMNRDVQTRVTPQEIRDLIFHYVPELQEQGQGVRAKSAHPVSS